MSGIISGINSTGTPLERGYTRGRLMPGSGDAAAQFGYTPLGLLLCDDAQHATGLRDAMGVGAVATDIAAVGGVSLYGVWARGFRGVRVPTDSFGWSAAQWDPALVSQAVVGAFVASASAVQNIGLWGYNSSLTPGRLYARIDTGTNMVTVAVASNGAAQSGSVTINHAIVFGDLYVLAYHINRTTGFLYTRLVNATTGIAYTGTPLDISTYVAITGTGTLSFHVGTITGAVNGTGIVHLGLAVFNSGIAGVDVVGDLTRRIVGT